MIVDADNLIVGRMASSIARMLLRGEKIDVVNSEKAVFSGSRTVLIEKYRVKLRRGPKGNPVKGPKFSRMPHKIVKATIENMLPKEKERGRKALKNLKVFIGVPKELEKEKKEKIEEAENRLHKKFVKVEELSKMLGASF